MTLPQETKGYLNGNQKGGYAAEYGNNTIDRVLGKKVESTAQVLDENGRQVKAGADRTVDGIEIQTKYYKTARESIGAAFKNGEPIYIRQDGSGKMMQIEVPRDQYPEALIEFQKKIDSGQIPNISPGEDAKNYVRRGHWTYGQAWNIAKAGTIESLTVDMEAGAVSSINAGSMTSIITFAQAIWSGFTVDESVEISLRAGFNVMGRSTMIYTLTMQLSRKEFGNVFVRQYTKDKIYKGQEGINNPIYNISNNIADKISSSTFATTKVGQKIGINTLDSRTVISNTVMGIIVFGPDICKAVSGKISTKQLFKNSAISVGGMAGAEIGNAIVPVLGGIIGGVVGGYIVKNTLDNFIEDDAKIMFRILKEEFLDVIMQISLTPEELNIVVSQTVANEHLDKMLQNMFQSGDARNYARDAIVQNAIQNILSKRKYISKQMQYDGLKNFIEEIA